MFTLSYKSFLIYIILQILIFNTFIATIWAMGDKPDIDANDIIPLPSPILKGLISVEEAISGRRTRRQFSSEPLTLKEWSQILWAAQGITSNGAIKKRTAPSAGALYPLDIYLILGKNALSPPGVGIFHYLPKQHSLRRLSDKDIIKKVVEASLYQNWMADAPGMIIITAEYKRITSKYGDRGIRYAYIEAGHVAQNCFLQAESLQLNVGIVGAFDDKAITLILPVKETHEPILILPIGRKRKNEP